MQVTRRLLIFLISLGCFAIGIANRVLYYNDLSEDRVEGWQYYQANVADWFLLGMVIFWIQLAVWCVVCVSRDEFHPVSFVAGLILSGVLTLIMCLYFTPDYLFQ
ncbi:MAG: hypothetical protein FJ303_00480 [Planctomycetes bacterium]|nr:hypothetical protein [Planctomycetota bacterium]